ncbi:MAG: hypothetical protein ACYCTE_06815 [Acidimicrobiales bacterium]
MTSRVPPSPELSAQRRRSANLRWAYHEPDRLAATAAARKSFLDTFERAVDPLGELSPAERAKRARNARSAYFSELAIKSAASRRARKAAKT